MNKNKENTDRDVVRMIARKNGSHLRPSEYISLAANKPYDRKVSNSTVTKAIGSYANRLSTDAAEAAFIAKQLLRYCKHDLAYAEHILSKAFLS